MLPLMMLQPGPFQRLEKAEVSVNGTSGRREPVTPTQHQLVPISASSPAWMSVIS